MVVLPNTTAAEAVIALDHVRKLLREQQFPGADGNGPTVTFSAGVVDILHDGHLEAALEEADRLLYLAKAAGRDRILDSEPQEVAGS